MSPLITLVLASWCWAGNIGSIQRVLSEPLCINKAAAGHVDKSGGAVGWKTKTVSLSDDNSLVPVSSSNTLSTSG